MSGLVVDIPFAFQATVMKKRGRTWRDVVATDFVTVEIPVVEGAVTFAEWTVGYAYGREPRRQGIALHDGRDFLNVFGMAGSYGIAHRPAGATTIAEFLGIADGSVPTMGFDFLPGLMRFPSSAETVLGPTIDAMVRSKTSKVEGMGAFHPDLRLDETRFSVLRSDREERRAAALAAFSSLVIVEDYVLAKGPEPVLTTHFDRGFVDHVTPWPRLGYSSWSLPLGQEATEEDPWADLKIVVHRPDLSRFDPIPGNCARIASTVAGLANLGFSYARTRELKPKIALMELAAELHAVADTTREEASAVVSRAFDTILTERADRSIQAFHDRIVAPALGRDPLPETSVEPRP